MHSASQFVPGPELVPVTATACIPEFPMPLPMRCPPLVQTEWSNCVNLSGLGFKVMLTTCLCFKWNETRIPLLHLVLGNRIICATLVYT
jgi:hypothetical protein